MYQFQEYLKGNLFMNTNIDYGWLSLIPPFVAIILAMWKKQIVIALFVAVWIGATIIYSWNPFIGFTKTISDYILNQSLANVGNISVIVFCLAIGGMIGIISKMGGIGAIAESITKIAKGSKNTQLAAIIMGIAVFFDDYANTMVVGKTMRPLTDKNRVSREKLAFIVDSTAGTVASMAPVSTWIAMELGLIAAGLATLHIKANVLMVFFASVPFRFYSIFALLFVFNIVLQNRDYGEMLKAESRTRKTGKLYNDGANLMSDDELDSADETEKVGSIWDAAIPICSFLFLTLFGLWYSGRQITGSSSILICMGSANTMVVLTWTSLASTAIAVVIGLLKKSINLNEAMKAWINGTKTMILACVVLTLIFALKGIVNDMNMTPWIIANTHGYLNGDLLPFLVFILTSFIGFAAGSAWASASIVFPIAISLSASASGNPHAVTPLMIATIGSVLTGSVFGNHLSPVSDTTTITAVAANSDIIDHVKTQVPYIFAAGVFACLVGFIPAGFGVPAWQSLILGFIAIFVFVRIRGKKLDSRGNIITKSCFYKLRF